jgi:hypothetical protein
MRTRLLILLVAAGSCLGAPRLVAQGGESVTTLSPDSDGGGTSFTITCGPDRVLIGITGAAGQWVDRVQGLCMQVTNEGQWIGSETTTPPTVGTSGTPFSIRCAANSAVSALSGRSGSWVDRLQVHCSPLSFAGTVQSTLQLAGAAGGTGGTTGFGPNTCEDRRPARAITGTMGQVLGVGTVGRIGLRCARAAVLGLDGLSLMAFSTSLPNPSRGQVALTRATPSSFSVSLASSNPAVATVPATVAVSAGQSSASFTIRAVATGCTVIKASADNVSSVEPFVVQFPPQGDLTQFELATPNQVLYSGNQAQGSVRVGGRGGQVTLVSSNPSVVAVPPTVTPAVGSMGIAAFPIRALAPGCATITATLGSLVYRRVVMVQEIGG